MHIDAITLAAVVDEWRTLLTAARIDTIIAPTEYAIALQCYAPALHGQGGNNRWLYLSAHPQLARAHLSASKPSKIASEPSPFVMLLRKYLEGTRIEAIEQPRWERIVEMVTGYRSSPESSERIHYRLMIELMGRMSNIILCDEQGLILGSLKHVGADVNRYRVIAANVRYVAPPPQQHTLAGQLLPRLEPASVTATQLRMITAEEAVIPTSPPAKKSRSHVPEQVKLWQLLTRHLLGFSPLLASEAVYRTTGDTETAVYDIDAGEGAWGELARNVRELAALYDRQNWHPQLVERTGTGAEAPGGNASSSSSLASQSSRTPTPIAFAPYVLKQYAGMPGVLIRQSPSMNILIDEYYAGVEWRDAMESVRAPLRKVLQTQRARCLRKAELLQRELAITEEAARYRLQAELLLAYQHEVQRGAASVTLQNFFEEQGEGHAAEITITLDPRFDAVGNANRLFNKYHKLRRALALLPTQIEQNAVELATVEQLLADLILAENPAEVALVKAEVQTAGYMRGASAPRERPGKQGQQGKKSHKGKQSKGKPVPPGGGVPLHVQSRDGFTLLIGKNSRQNEVVTFQQATANDIWLHARGVPGAHVIIKAGGLDVPRSTIEQAAQLAAYYSQARGSTTVPVDYTLQRYVRHMKGGGPGMVIYERERTIYAEPNGA